MFGDTPTFSSFAVGNSDEAKRFYEDTLGIRVSVIVEEAGLLSLNLAGDRDVFVYRKPDFTPAGYTVLNFQVEDVDEAVDELTSKGVTMERYEGFDQDEKGISRGRGPDIAWFKDPAGNVLSVLKQVN